MITIELPWIDTILLPNKQDGILKFGPCKAKYAVSTARDRAKSDAYYLALQAIDSITLKEGIDYSIEVIYCPPLRARVDEDNFARAMKPSMDGIAKALGINDYHFNPVTRRRGPHVDGGRVTVIIDDLPF